MSTSQSVALAIIPKLSSFPSLITGLLTVYEIVIVRKQQGEVYYRILVALNTSIIVFAIMAF
jgi:hypothetical protein